MSDAGSGVQPPLAHALGQRVLTAIGLPKDEWEIAAHLEVIGVRDTDARQTYGAADVFDLARAIHDDFVNGLYDPVTEPVDDEERGNPVTDFLRHYLSGLTFALPMALQAISMLVWGYGLWGALDLDLRTGTAIALGFIGSYVLSGGFTQAIVRRGLYYMYQHEFVFAKWVSWTGWWLSVRVMLATLPPLLVVNAVFGLLPWSMVFTAAAYYVALSILWLNWSLLYVVRKTYHFITVTAVALAGVLVAAKSGGASPIAANAVGLAIADALSFVLARYYLSRAAAKSGREVAVNPPRLAVLVYSTSRFFVYGLLYNSLLFADRVIAWTTAVGREDFPPYDFWLSVRYELGMDIALIAVMLTSGVIEHFVQRFSDSIIPAQKRVGGQDAPAFVEEQLAAFGRRSIAVAATAIVAAVAAWGVSMLLRRLPNPEFQAALLSTTTSHVFWIATVSYVFFLVALHGVLVLLTLSRVELATRAVGIALAVNVAVGFVCSRAIHYSAAVGGLLAGSVVLMILTRRAAKKVLSQLDYYYYSAF